jgi:hypothetical protein
VRSASVEQKFSVRHSEDVIHKFIDLIGYSRREALELTERRIRITQDGLSEGIVRPNTGNGVDHVYKVIAHAGKHSQGQRGVLKYAIKDYLESRGFECYQDMANGVFLVRLSARSS